MDEDKVEAAAGELALSALAFLRGFLAGQAAIVVDVPTAAGTKPLRIWLDPSRAA